ncbi:MAG TPA: DUF1993 domain-containing protein [Bauldia sp.]|nr:DUF1993 domain-containing protein [Bauldia sp.]
MPISLYDASVPYFTQMLRALAANLDKAAAYAARHRVEAPVMLGLRLYPDMLPLGRQVQIASDNAKGASARLAKSEIPRYEDNEATFDEMKARIAKTIDFMAGLDRDAFAGAEDRDVTWPSGGSQRTLRGKDYLFTHAIPNFTFHVTIAYAIMRHVGVELGKRDFLVGQQA